MAAIPAAAAIPPMAARRSMFKVVDARSPEAAGAKAEAEAKRAADTIATNFILIYYFRF